MTWKISPLVYVLFLNRNVIMVGKNYDFIRKHDGMNEWREENSRTSEKNEPLQSIRSSVIFCRIV